jgi:hypothetical protein
MPLLLTTLQECSLAIGRYPRFRYDARGGGGSGATPEWCDGGLQPLHFDPHQVRIPDLDRRSTRLLGLPLPPGVAIAIEPQQLEGELDPSSGALRLRFEAAFRLRLGPWCRPPQLQVSTELLTGPVRGRRHQAVGQPLDQRGRAVLVGVALVQPSGDAWLDRFLGLPDEALAILSCRLQWVEAPGT